MTTAPLSRKRQSRSALVRLYADVQKTADEQRRAAARRLHDSAQQTLAAASMSLALLERQAGSLNPAARAALTEAMQIVARCNQELRDVAQGLYPPLLDGMGLGAALRGLSARWGADRVSVTLEQLPRLPAARELTLFKLIEEAIESVFAPEEVVQLQLGPGGNLVLLGSSRQDPAEKAALLRLRLRAESDGGRLKVQRPRTRSQAGRVSTPRLPLRRPLRLDVRFARTLSPK